MAELDPHQAVTHILMNDALEANGRNREAATCHLLDAAATIIFDAHLKVGLDAADMAEHFAALFGEYLIAKVMAHAGGGK